MLKVLNAQIKERKRGEESGCIIEFDSMENIVKDTNLKLIYNEKSHYFNVDRISINPDNSLKISAHEVGYWATKFENMKTFDLRTLIGLEIEIVDDKDTIKRINEMSGWC